MPDGPEPAPTAVASLRALTDFPDRLSPVLVKELRQGLRGHMFVVPFLVLQALLIFTNAEPGRGATSAFWHFIIITLIFLLPSRSLGALGEERDANTLDTLVLTRLTPWRIVWGKWCAAAAQSLLVAVAIVPHLLARYLNRGTSFIEEGILLLMILFLSGGVAGVFTAASVIKSPLLRNAFAGAVMLGVYIWVCRPLISAVTSAGSLIPVAIQCEVMVLSIWAALFCMWHAAANIAPAVANLTTARRLTSLVAVVIFSALAGAVSGASEGVPEYGLLIMLGAISAVEMGEPLSPFPFKRSGGAGEVAGFLLSPGWNTGVLFCIVTWVVTGISSGMIFHPWFLAAISLCFFPVTARLIFPARMRMGVTPMVLLAGASHVLRMLLLSVDVSAEAFVGWLPGLYDRSAMRATETYVIPAIMWTGLALALALGSLLFHMRRRKG